MDAPDFRKIASRLYGRCWELLEVPDRSSEQDLELERAAMASLYHWSQVGGGQEIAIGEWMVSRAYVALRRPAEALRHAELARATPVVDAPDWLTASLLEGHARALALAQDPRAAEVRAEAERAAAAIADPEDRALIESQLAEPL